MSDSLVIGLWGAVWLGILTSISPCPLATNIAAISFVGRESGKTWGILAAGSLYAMGRAFVYTVIGWAVTASLLSAPGASVWLQRNVILFVGPLLVLVGMVLTGLTSFQFDTGANFERARSAVSKWGLLGSFFMGMLFALSFCPVSAALFFGSLIPLAAANGSPVAFSALYGIGTAIPVIVFTVAMIFGAKSLSGLFRSVSVTERKVRTVTGLVIMAVGMYYTLKYVYKVV
jgi:cytochrome c biogenesis protein CcdA